MIFIPCALIAYLIGAIPTGWLLAYYSGMGDITQHGSGNIGATNVGRFLGLRSFVIVLLFDCFKAYTFLSVLNYYHAEPFVIFVSSLGLLIGNSISVFLRGKGGKGVATTLGILLAYNPRILLFLIAIWLPTALITRTMGISCAVGLLGLPLYTLIYPSHDYYFTFLAFFMCIWGLWRHESNIRRYFSSKKVAL